MITDREIFMVYENIEKICKELDAMFTALDQVMNAKGFRNYSGELRWETSKSLGNPSGWLPYFSQRLYSKDDKNRVLGVNVIMKDTSCSNQIPFVTCGLIQGEKEVNTKSDELYAAGWHEEWGKHNKVPTTQLRISEYGEEGVKIISYFLRLTKIRDLSDIEKAIMRPLQNMYEGIPRVDEGFPISDIVKKTVLETQDYTLDLEQIRGLAENAS